MQLMQLVQLVKVLRQSRDLAAGRWEKSLSLWPHRAAGGANGSVPLACSVAWSAETLAAFSPASQGPVAFMLSLPPSKFSVT